MPTLSFKTTETTEEFQQRRLVEKQHGRELAKLRVLTKKYSGEYLKTRVDDYGITYEQVKKDVPELYTKIEPYLKKKEDKPEEKPQESKAKKKKKKKKS